MCCMAREITAENHSTEAEWATELKQCERHGHKRKILYSKTMQGTLDFLSPVWMTKQCRVNSLVWENLSTLNYSPSALSVFIKVLGLKASASPWLSSPSDFYLLIKPWAHNLMYTYYSTSIKNIYQFIRASSWVHHTFKLKVLWLQRFTQWLHDSSSCKQCMREVQVLHMCCVCCFFFFFQEKNYIVRSGGNIPED